MNLVDRVKNILLQPKDEWPKIAQEPSTIQEIYLGYVIILAAIPAIAGFLGLLLLGGAFGALGVGIGFGVGITHMLVSYVMSLIGVIVLAFIVDALAPTFGSEKNLTQAFKLCAYAQTAGWVAGAFLLIPLLGWLVALIGAIYGLYLFYLGLPILMKTPEAKVVPYMVVVILVAIVLYWITAIISRLGSFAGAY